MKKKINHILPALVLTASLGLTTVSCNGFLDEMPDNRTELNTDQKIAKLLVSAYADVSPNELFELYSDNSDDSGPTYGYYKLSEQECYHWQDTKEEYQDTPHHPEFPSCVLRPHEKYHSVTEYRFSVQK